MAMALLSFTILTLFISSSASALHKDLTKNFTNKELGDELSTTAVSSNTKEEFSSVNYSFPNSPALPVTTDSDGDGVLDMNDLDDDNDGILDTDEGAYYAGSVTLDQFSAIPSGTYAGDPNGIRLSDATGSFSVDIYVGDLTTAGRGSTFNTSYGNIVNSGSLTNTQLVEYVYTTENSPTPFQFKAVTIQNIVSLDGVSTATSYRDAFTWSELGTWTPLSPFNGSNRPRAAVVSVSDDASDKVGTFVFQDPDGNSQPSDINDIGAFSVPYNADPDNVISDVLLNMIGSANGHYAEFDFEAPHDQASMYVFNSGGSIIWWNFNAKLEVFVDETFGPDTDNDGIPNYLDLDSDGDGCYDVSEAGFYDPNLDGILGGASVTVDAQGRVTSGSGAYTGTKSFVTDFTCSDIDSDGVIDRFDLDDDNDGILDENELSDNCALGGGQDFNEFTHSNTSAVNVQSLSSNSIAVSRLSGGWVSTYSTETFSLPMLLEFTVDDVSTLAMIGLIGVTKNKRPNSFNDQNHEFYFYSGISYRVRDFNATCCTSGYAVDDLFSIEIDAEGNLVMKQNGTSVYTDTVDDTEFQLTLTTGSGVAKPFYNMVLTDQLICDNLDTDNDGTPDRIDTDSDGDGCFDALEAGYYPPLVSQTGELIGSVDASGLSENLNNSLVLAQEISDPALQSDYCCGFTDGTLDCDLDGFTNDEEYAGICGQVGNPFDPNLPFERWETTATANSSDNTFKLTSDLGLAAFLGGELRVLTVKSGHTLTLTENLTVQDLIIESSGVVDLNGNTLSVKGDLQLDGNLDFSSGTVEFTGTCGEQLINATNSLRLEDLVIDNGSTVTLGTALSITGVIRAESGTLDLNNQNVKLISELVNGTVQTGSVGEIKSGADIIGSLNLQRYVESLEDGYRLLGVPFKNLTVADISDDFVSTGFTGSDWPNHYFTNLKYYDEAGRVEGDINSGFKDVQNVTDSLLQYQGYWAYFPPSQSANLLEVGGEFNKGQITYDLSYTSSGVAQNDGWHCVINPYPSAIDLSSNCIQFNNVSPAIYILDHTIGGTWKGEYVAYNDGVSVNGGTKEVASFQAFMVQATGPGASIVFNECAKTDVQGTFYRSGEAEKPLIRLAMKNTEAYYETVIAFDDQATAIFDPEKDARRWQSVMFSLATVAGEDTLAINNLPLDSEGIEIPVIISAPEAGTFALEITEVTDLETRQCLYIEDLLTGEVISIREGEEISFTVGEANYYEERFIIRSRQIAEASSNSPFCSGEESGLVQITLADERTSDIKWFTEENELIHSAYGGFSELDSLPAGSYYAEVEDPGGICGTTVFEIDIIQTEQQIIELASTPDYCSEGYAEISVNVTESEEWTVTLLQDYEEVALETSGSELLFTDLKGMVYDLIVETECIREEFVLDLTDPDAVESYFEAPHELLIEQLNEGVEVEALSINADHYEWFINEYYKGDGDVISLTFDEVGVHTLKLNSSNEHCQDEHSQDIMVSAASVIEENLEKDFLTINKENAFEIVRLNDQSGRIDVILFDITGKAVAQELQSEKQAITIEKGNLAAGIYILEIRTQTGVILSKKYYK